MNLELNSWQDLFKLLILLAVAAGGAPVTQLFKNLLSLIFKKPVEDRWALLLTGVVSAIFAVLEMWLSGVLDFSDLSLDKLPQTFFAVFSVATLYYGWMKGSQGFFGRKFLLKRL